MKNTNIEQIKKANAALVERGEADAIGDYFSPKYS